MSCYLVVCSNFDEQTGHSACIARVTPCPECDLVPLGPKQVHQVARGPPDAPMSEYRTVRVCPPCKMRLMNEVAAQHPNWDPFDPTQPAQVVRNGYPCRECAKLLGWKSRRCGSHIDATEKLRISLERAEKREYWDAKRQVYRNERRVLNDRFRKLLLAPETRCAACDERPDKASDLHLEHKISVVSIVRSGKSVREAYVPENLWFLCKDCHNVKTRGIREPPPIKNLARTHWGLVRTNAEMKRDYLAWQEAARERKRRDALISTALETRPPPSNLQGNQGRLDPQITSEPNRHEPKATGLVE